SLEVAAMSAAMTMSPSFDILAATAAPMPDIPPVTSVTLGPRFTAPSRLLGDRRTGVDDPGGAVDMRRFVGSQERDSIGNVLRTPVAQPFRARHAASVDHLLIKGVDHAGLDRARQDRIDPDGSARNIKCGHTGQAEHRMLARDVTGKATSAADRRGRGDVDD